MIDGFGPSEKIRTSGLLNPIQARYQLRYTRIWPRFLLLNTITHRIIKCKCKIKFFGQMENARRGEKYGIGEKSEKTCLTGVKIFAILVKRLVRMRSAVRICPAAPHWNTGKAPVILTVTGAFLCFEAGVKIRSLSRKNEPTQVSKRRRSNCSQHKNSSTPSYCQAGRRRYNEFKILIQSSFQNVLHFAACVISSFKAMKKWYRPKD